MPKVLYEGKREEDVMQASRGLESRKDWKMLDCWLSRWREAP